MAKTDNNTLVFKLMIDGKEARAELDLTKGEFVQVGEEAVKSNEKIKTAYKGLSAEAQKNNTVTDASVDSLYKYIQTQELSVDIIEKTILALKNETDALPVNSAAWKQKMAAADNLRLAMAKVTTEHMQLGNTQKGMLPGQQQTNMAMMQFGYILNDAQMFMVNARMGLMGIANNIPMVVQGLMQAKQAGDGTTSVFKMITSSLTGAGGLIIGINALMLIMNMLPGLFEDTTESVEKQKDAIKQLKEEYAKLTREQINNYIATREEELRKFNEKHAGSELVQIGGLQSDRFERREIKDPERRYGDDYARVKEIQDEIAALKDVGRDLGIIENIRNRISLNQEQLNKLNETESSPFYYKNIVKTAQSYNEAKNTLEQWIASDEKLVRGKEAAKNKTTDDFDKDAFTKLEKELSLKQQHEINLAKIEGESNAALLEMKRQHLVDKIDLYEDYNQDVLALTLDLIETQKEIEKATVTPAINIEAPEDSPLLGDVLTESDYKKQLQQDELKTWYDAENEKISAYENYTDLKILLDEEYKTRKENIDRESLITTLGLTSQLLGQLSSIFAKHTAAYKMLAIAQVWIETYKGVMALYSPPPVGVGPVLAPFMTAAVIGTGALQAANIAKQDTSVKGYAEGGRLPKGKAGAIEGWHNELVAPEETFVDVVNDLIGQSIISAKHYFSSGGGDNGLASEIALMRQDLNTLLSRIPYAIVETDTALKIGDIIDDNNRSTR